MSVGALAFFRRRVDPRGGGKGGSFGDTNFLTAREKEGANAPGKLDEWDRDRQVSSLGLTRDLVILACAISAGIHGALVPGHFDEGSGAGLGFVAATVLLATAAVAITLRPANSFALAAAAAVLAGLLASYLLAVTTGLPFIHPQPEPIDGLGLATKAIESVGLAAAAALLWRPSAAPTRLQPKGQ